MGRKRLEFMLKIFGAFFWVGQFFGDHNYINPVLQVNGLSDFDDFVTIQEKI
jgi:hypothetical protein